MDVLEMWIFLGRHASLSRGITLTGLGWSWLKIEQNTLAPNMVN